MSSEHVDVRGGICRIELKSRDGKAITGTGFLVRPDLILTALHVLADRKPSEPEFFPMPYTLIFLDGTEEIKREVNDQKQIVDFDRAADWALLSCEPTSLPLIPLAYASGEGAAWTSYGFVHSYKPGLDLRGEIVRCNGPFYDETLDQRMTAVVLYCQTAAAGIGLESAGCSGAPCIVKGAAVGILRAHLSFQGHTVGGTYWATPIDQVAEKSEKFRNRLGLPDWLYGLPGLSSRHLQLPVAPFPGLAPFDSQSAELYFGRDVTIRQIYDWSTEDDREPMLLLYGASGVGKSSLIKAGLISRWENSGVNPVPIDGGWDDNELTSKLSAAPCLLILDQFESVYTVGNGQTAVMQIFQGLRQLIPPGKGHRILVSFRKEWLAEISEAATVSGWPSFEQTLLEPLNASEIESAVTGVTRIKRLQRKYRLQIDPGLAERIAADLTSDPESQVGPMLQILLQEMWESSPTDQQGQRRFTLDMYRSMRKALAGLVQFVERQLTRGSEPLKEAAETGLLLDLLAWHVNRPTATARTNSSADLEATYPHVIELARRAVTTLVDLRLLGGSLAEGTRLAHDTLAPIVLNRHQLSVAVGQQAARILESRRTGAEFIGSPLGRGELEIVERGRSGMRALSPDEKRLIAVSHARHELQRAIDLQRVRQRDLRSALQAGLRALEAPLSAGEESDPLAVATGLEMLMRAGGEPLVFPGTGEVRAVAISPDGALVALLRGTGLYIADLSCPTNSPVWMTTDGTNETALAFSQHGNYLLAPRASSPPGLWRVKRCGVSGAQSNPEMVPFGLAYYSRRIGGHAKWALGADERFLVVTGMDGFSMWDLAAPPLDGVLNPLKDEKFETESMYMESYSHIAFSPSGNLLALIWHDPWGGRSLVIQQGPHWGKVAQVPLTRVMQGLAFVRDDVILVRCESNTTCLLCEENKWSVVETLEQSVGTFDACLEHEGGYIAILTQSGMVSIANLPARRFHTLETYGVIAMVNSGDQLLLLTNTGTIRFWRLNSSAEKPATKEFELLWPRKFKLEGGRLHVTQHGVLAVSDDGEICFWQRDAKQGFALPKIIEAAEAPIVQSIATEDLLWVRSATNSLRRFWMPQQATLSPIVLQCSSEFAFSDDGRWILVVDEGVQLYELRENFVEYRAKIPMATTSPVTALAMSDFGDIVVGTADGQVFLFYDHGAASRIPFTTGARAIEFIQIIAGRKLLTWDGREQIRLWLLDHTPPHEFILDAGQMWSTARIVRSIDGLVCTSTDDPCVAVWRIGDISAVADRSIHATNYSLNSEVANARFVPGAERIVVISQDLMTAEIPLSKESPQAVEQVMMPTLVGLGQLTDAKFFAADVKGRYFVVNGCIRTGAEHIARIYDLDKPLEEALYGRCRLGSGPLPRDRGSVTVDPRGRFVLVMQDLKIPHLEDSKRWQGLLFPFDRWARTDEEAPEQSAVVLSDISVPSPSRGVQPKVDISPDGRWAALLAPDGELRLVSLDSQVIMDGLRRVTGS